MELLVAITNMIVVAALSMTAISKMVAKANSTKEKKNLRQMGPLFTIHATGRNMMPPPCKGLVTIEDGTTVERHWYDTLFTLLFANTDPDEFKQKAWWDRNDTFIRNPLFKETALPRGWSPPNP